MTRLPKSCIIPVVQQQLSPQISVVILAYNEEATIAGCLESIVAQSQPADEIIVVNNNSTDRTAEIAKRFPLVRLVNESVQGFTPARNCGFNEARYPVIVRFDADGVMPSGWLANVRSLFTAQPHLLGASGPVYYHDLWGMSRVAFPFPGNQLYMRVVGCWPTLVGPNMVITKHAWELVKDELHSNDRIVHEDMDLAIHIRHYGEIAYDRRLTTTTSARRLVSEPTSFFLEYPLRNLRTVLIHWPWPRRMPDGRLVFSSGRKHK
jgi:glycosyltransferase involved in cell wall biosynthesis